MMKNKEFFDDIAGQVKQFFADRDLSTAERSQVMRQLFDSVTAVFDDNSEAVMTIESPNVSVELIDEKTGNLYRRYLELEYFENDNGIRLIGEDMASNEASIVFISETALKKLHDLQGHGPDAPRCDHD